METFFDWIANGGLSWAAYRVFMYGRLIEIDKNPGIHPVRVGETWRLLFDEIFIKVTVPEATMACWDDHLCAGIKA